MTYLMVRFRNMYDDKNNNAINRLTTQDNEKNILIKNINTTYFMVVN